MTPYQPDQQHQATSQGSNTNQYNVNYHSEPSSYSNLHPWQNFWRNENNSIDTNNDTSNIYGNNNNNNNNISTNTSLDQQQEYLWGSGAPTKSLATTTTNTSDGHNISSNQHDNGTVETTLAVTCKIDTRLESNNIQDKTYDTNDLSTNLTSALDNKTIDCDDNGKHVEELIGPNEANCINDESSIDSSKLVDNLSESSRMIDFPNQTLVNRIELARRDGENKEVATSKSISDQNERAIIGNSNKIKECPVDALDQLISSTIGDITIYAEKDNITSIDEQSNDNQDEDKRDMEDNNGLKE